ncbi:hypothetical protein CIRMBP1208_00823 [Enterococcus cecorum]|nr:hypothetical protein CIRMBP1208_00823 [Enterococcus cecorum]
MNLDELKEKAKKLNLYVNKLYNEKAEILLKNDLNEFIEKNKNHIRKKMMYIIMRILQKLI